MPRYRLRVEYDGRAFRGFQSQVNGASVQAALEGAVFAFSAETVRVHAAGRTDAGVHATGQVTHLDLVRSFAPDVVRDALNAHLAPLAIAILAVDPAPDDFHARFSAIGRRYLYRILDRKAPPALDAGRVWWLKRPLDASAMHAAAAALRGLHDFTTFRDVQCQARTPVKTLDVAEVSRVGEEVHLVFAARSFLHRQVRSMAGSLAQVGLGRWSAAELAAALDARDRTRCGQVAPAHGLYLTGVDYPQVALAAAAG